MRHTDKMNKIAEHVKARRQELLLSYQDLADKTGLSKSTLQRYESGTIKNISLDKFELLARALEIDPEELLGWNKQKSHSDDRELTEKELILLENFNKLNDSGKDKLIEYSNDLNYNIKFIYNSNIEKTKAFLDNFDKILEAIDIMSSISNDKSEIDNNKK